MEPFRGIGTILADVVEVGLTVWQYVYVDNNHMSTRVAYHHLYQLMVLYPHQLNLTTIRGCFGILPRDITLISDEDLWKLGPVNLVIAEWPCQGHSRARAGRGLEDLMSNFFGTTSGSCSGGLSTNLPLRGTYSRMYLCWETLGIRCWMADIMFVNTLGILFLWIPHDLVHIPTMLGGFGPTSHCYLL